MTPELFLLPRACNDAPTYPEAHDLQPVRSPPSIGAFRWIFAEGSTTSSQMVEPTRARYSNLPSFGHRRRNSLVDLPVKIAGIERWFAGEKVAAPP